MLYCGWQRGSLNYLGARIGLSVCDKPFERVVQEALALSWTRDPFDRLIVAQAAVGGDLLVTRDKTILQHYEPARW